MEKNWFKTNAIALISCLGGVLIFSCTLVYSFGEIRTNVEDRIVVITEKVDYEQAEREKLESKTDALHDEQDDMRVVAARMDERINNMDKKLDRILESLDNIKASLP